MKVLIACEESQVVCKAFRERGHEAYSCDIQECSGGHPEWHLRYDILKVIDPLNFFFNAQNGDLVEVNEWDLMIAHPDCTRLTVAANKYYKPEYSTRFPNIHKEREEAVIFFMKLATCGIKKKAIENPIGIMSSRWRKPNQIIQPWQFGHSERKGTCLWLENLTPLKPTKIVEPEIIIHKSGRTDSRLHYESLRLPKEERRRVRSRTFEGIDKAMAEQWG